MAAAFSFAYSLLKDDDMPFNKKKDGGARKNRNLANARASKVEHAQERMRTGPTEDPDDPYEYDTQDGSEKPIGEDEDTGYDLRTTEERTEELKMRKSAFKKAWSMLKALPEQQMFVERTRRQNAGEDNPYEEHYDRPEIDRFGARSLGTVHPSILGMLQRRANAHNLSEGGAGGGIPPNLNLDSGREEDRTMHPEVLRYQPERSERAGMSIAQGPEFNRRAYDRYGGGSARTPLRDYPMSEDIYHNPDTAARGGPFDSSRYASGHPHPENFITGYGHQPGHKISHPTDEEIRG